jgi:hypothetical protein
MAKPHTVVRLGGIEADEQGRPYGDTVFVVDEDGNASYWSWRSFDWISAGVVPDSPASDNYRVDAALMADAAKRTATGPS